MIAARSQVNRRRRRRARSNPDFADRFKPRKLSDLIGGEFIQAYFKAQGARSDYDRDRILLTGPSGSGKTSAAVIIAMAFAQGQEKLIRQVAAGGLVTQQTERGRVSSSANPIPIFIKLFESKTIAEAGEGKETAALEPGAFRFDQRTPEPQPGVSDIAWHVGIIDQVDQFDESEQNDLLGLLDSMPARTMMICTTIFPERLEPQLRNRFREFKLANPTEKQLASFIRAVAGAQKPQWPITAGESQAIARDSLSGGFRTALEKLENAMVTGQLRSGTIAITKDPGIGASRKAVALLEAAEEGEAIVAARASERELPAIALMQEEAPKVEPFAARPGKPAARGPKFDFRDKKFGQSVKGTKVFKVVKSGVERNAVLDAQISIVEALVESGILSTAKDFTKTANKLARGAGEFSNEKRQATILRLAARRLIKGTAKNPHRRRPPVGDIRSLPVKKRKMLVGDIRSLPAKIRKALVETARRMLKAASPRKKLVVIPRSSFRVTGTRVPAVLSTGDPVRGELFRPVDPRTFRAFGEFTSQSEAALTAFDLFGAPVLLQSSLAEGADDNRAKPRRHPKFVKQAVFFDPKAFSKAEARAWIKKQGEKIPKGKRIERIEFTSKKTGRSRGVWFGWGLRKIKKGTRIRFQPFGKHIMVRFMISGPKAKSNPTATGNASVKITDGGFAVFHSTNGTRLSGTFRGPGAKGRALKRAREIVDRNFPSCRGSTAKRCKVTVEANRTITTSSRGPFTATKNVSPTDVARFFKRSAIKVRKAIRRQPVKQRAQFVLTLKPIARKLAGRAFTPKGGRLRRDREALRWVVINLNAPPARSVMSQDFKERSDAIRALRKITDGLRATGFTVQTVDPLAIENPAVGVAKVRGGFALVDTMTGKRIPGFDPYKTKAAAQKHVKQVQSELNPRPSMLSAARRAEFLDNGRNPHELPTDSVHIADTRIPLKNLIFIGNYRQINYAAPKFGGSIWREYRHRPIGFSKEATKLMSKDGGLVFLHPKGAYMLVVPARNQKGRFTMNKRGLLN